MEWEDKVKLVQLGNQRHESPEAKKEFQEYVITNVQNFDAQAWSMFSELTDIFPDEMKQDVEYWKTIHPHVKKAADCDDRFGLRAAMRIELILIVCKKDLNLT
ncbi:MAG: hypothetical protein WC333_02335 [Dehalococcoidia bacterium]|jgi:hypothetical protein